MSAALIAAYGTVGKLVSHLHLPVQSGSDRVLAAMKRGYTALEYKSIVRRLRAARSGLSLTSDFIVGFPGETDADFERTMALVAEVGFDGAFTFAYSPRPGTPAAELPDQVPPAVKQARLERLHGAARCAIPRVQRRDGRHAAARARDRPRRQGSARAAGAHGEQPRRQFRRRACARRPLRDVTITAALPHSLRGELVAAMSAAGPPQGANCSPSGGSAAAKPQAWGHT